MYFPRLGPAILGVLVALVCGTTSAQAQDASPPAHISHAEGVVTLEREGEIYDDVHGVPFVAGDLLRTVSGRAEVLFPDGSLVHVDDRSALELLDDTLFRLTDGRLLLVVAGADNASNALQYQIDTPAASVYTDGPGEFRLTMLPSPAGAQAELSVVRGYASLSTDLGVVSLAAGQRSVARDGAAPAYAQAFNTSRLDAFDSWSLARRGERAVRATSTQYLPSDLRIYGSTFDRHGRWEYEEPHGYVWYPTVAVSWRPYHVGYWRSYPRYGWTWIGHDPWGWPTHHYGRWGYKQARWYWIPGRVWGPAWVHWVGAPTYVGWSPLGWDNRPIFSFAFGSPNVWASWVVIPRSSFGVRHHYVHHHYVPWNRIPRGTAFASYEAAAPVVSPHRSASVRRAPDRGVAALRLQPDARARANVSSVSRPVPQGRGSAPVDARSAVARSGVERRSAAAPQANVAAPGRSQAPARTVTPRSAVRTAPSAGSSLDDGARSASTPPRSVGRPSAIRRAEPVARPGSAPDRPETSRVVPRSTVREPGQASPPPRSAPGARTTSPRAAISRPSSARPEAPRVTTPDASSASRSAPPSRTASPRTAAPRASVPRTAVPPPAAAPPPAAPRPSPGASGARPRASAPPAGAVSSSGARSRAGVQSAPAPATDGGGAASRGDSGSARRRSR